MEDRFFQHIFSSFIDGILLVSKDLKILMGNQAVEEMFGRALDSFAGRPLSDLFPDPAELNEKAAATMATGLSYRDLECRGFRKSGRVRAFFPAGLTLSPWLNDDGAVQGVLILVKDMSLLKELEKTSRQTDHLNTLEALAIGMAHEIRNPLGGIRGSAQLLLKELEHDDQREYLKVVIAEVDRINRLVKRMMDFTRPPSIDIRKINIHKVLNGILILQKELLASKGIGVQQFYDPSLPDIEADEDQLVQVFLNLIKNAIEASPQKKGIRLSTRVSSGYAIKSRKDPHPRQSIIVEIADSGMGIEDKALASLFTPFYTTKSRGSGMGLPISLKIVENHHGKIQITSEKGAGTTVQVFLPVRQR